MAGGAALSQDLAKTMKCDGYGKDAMACVEKAKELLEQVKLSTPAAS
jgi:methanogenic corrinoid protein MtbC1